MEQPARTQRQPATSTSPQPPACSSPVPSWSVMSANVEAYHFFPHRPVVRVAIPGAQRVADPLPPEDRGELSVVLVHGVAVTDREDQVLVFERRESVGIVLVLHEVERVTGVDVVVRVP